MSYSPTDSPYPEHERLHKAKEELGTEYIGQFLEWLNASGLRLAKFHEHSDDCYEIEDRGIAGLRRSRECDMEADELVEHREPIMKLLARYAGIDLNKLEDEKRAMLAEVRRGL